MSFFEFLADDSWIVDTLTNIAHNIRYKLNPMDIHDPMEGSHQPRPDTVLDPVCGMHVDPLKARATAEHQGQTYYFCSEGCARRFSAEPEKYLAKPPQTVPALAQLARIAPA